jgi:hypothetical protein
LQKELRMSTQSNSWVTVHAHHAITEKEDTALDYQNVLPRLSVTEQQV